MGESTIHYVGTSSFANPHSSAVADVVFVHGLNGDKFSTWRSGDSDDNFWPRWLANEHTNVNVWTAEYDASALAGVFTGKGGSIIDHSTILRDILISRSIGTKPLIFITHSLGGLVVKQMLRKCNDSSDAKHKALLAATRGLVFIGTPHQGAQLASSICLILGLFLSTQLKDLSYASDLLVDLNEWFRNWAATDNISVIVYYELKKTGKFQIVDKVTANPGVHGCQPTAIDADHISICKPSTQQSHLYVSVTAFTRDVILSTTGLSCVGPPDELASSLGMSSAVSSGELVPIIYRSSAVNAGQASRELTHPKVAVDDASRSRLPAEILTDYEYYTTEAPDDRRTLSQKLSDSGRKSEIKEAERKKERFSMSLQKHIAQASAITRYTHLMSEIETRFSRHVLPAINNGADANQVNSLLQSQVLDPVRMQHGTSTDITASVIESALYYLTGNCHVRWDPSKD